MFLYFSVQGLNDNLVEFLDFGTSSYSYEEEDFPLQLPIENLQPVAMTLQGSSRLSTNADDKVAVNEWRSMVHYVSGFGRLRLGPDRRLVRSCQYYVPKSN